MYLNEKYLKHKYRMASFPTALGWLCAVSVVLIHAGCMSIKLDREMVPGNGDWAMEGASAQHQHTASAVVDPPLYEQWRYDVGSGVGPAGALIVNEAVIVGTRKGMVHSMNIATGKRLGRIKHDAPIEGGMAVGDGRLFLPIAGDKKSVVAYDLNSGKKLWTLKGAPVEAGLLYAENTLIAVNSEAEGIALDARTGEERWRKSLGEQTTVLSTPLVLDDHLFVIEEMGKIFCLNFENGSLLWERALGSPVYNTASSDGASLFIPTTRGRLFSVDGKNGKINWTYAVPDTTVRFTAPAYAREDNRIIVSATSGDVRSIDAATGEVVWTTSLDGAINAAPLITDNTIYVGTMRKNLHALDRQTGIDVWSQELTGRIKSAVATYGNSLVVMAETQQVIALSTQNPDADEEQVE